MSELPTGKTFRNKISTQANKTALLPTNLSLTCLFRAPDLDVGQGSRSRTPYSYPLAQLRGISAIPTHPSGRNFWHAVNAGSPQLCRDAHTCARFWFLPTRQLAQKDMRARQLLGSHYEITPVCNSSLIGRGRCCECTDFFFFSIWYVGNSSPPSTD